MSGSTKYVYSFGNSITEGSKQMKKLLGGKGANLSEMCSLGVPVPPGFTLSTEACKHSLKNRSEWPTGLLEQVYTGILHIEKEMRQQYGDEANPLLVSVRSGAAVSMPGMMDTILNLGMNDKVVEGLIKKTENPRFVYDSYRRFIDMFGNVVMGISHNLFEQEIDYMKLERQVKEDVELSADDLLELSCRFKKIYKNETGEDFPEDPKDQLIYAINAVFESWNNERAVKYRKINNIKGLIGTAVTVQAMVFGNMGKDSGTGVCFTRNPSTGEADLYGEYLINAQGEDVVAGIRTPILIKDLAMKKPRVYEDLQNICLQLEEHYKDMQDIEFTIQNGQLFILQTRNGKRTGHAAVKIAVDLVNEGIVDRKTAIRDLVEPKHLEQLLHPQFKSDSFDEDEIIGTGLAASPGAAVGKVVFDPQKAEEAKENGEAVILVRIETSPEDVGGMASAEGILTARGGMTSHAAVVARGWGKPCVAGCHDIVVDYNRNIFKSGDITVSEGDWISLDGTTGNVILGKKELEKTTFNPDYKTFISWVYEEEVMAVRANADTPEDAEVARSYGAAGIGLTRTEHMFFKPGRINYVRKMIMAENEEDRKTALDELLPFQKEDFAGIFEAMDGLPVTIRLLDPPLHEFLPSEPAEIKKVAHDLGISEEKLIDKINLLKEYNPMLGHRGCRLGISYPEITEMQARAILEAACELQEKGVEVLPEIMIPLIGSVEEFVHQRKIIDRVAEEVFSEIGDSVEYQVGTMIEIPRAALLAGKIAREADFFSFGTNDLTQLTFGFSRDDVVKFLPQYLDMEILQNDPFQELDEDGVGLLVQTATEAGRNIKGNLKIGICGEHGGDPKSIAFAYKTGLNYVSCSPFRIPIAHLASVQATLSNVEMEESKVTELSAVESIA
ncbi:MAG: pyruvate, phosphate dikinase [Balneolaceae bacterium]